MEDLKLLLLHSNCSTVTTAQAALPHAAQRGLPAMNPLSLEHTGCERSQWRRLPLFFSKRKKEEEEKGEEEKTKWKNTWFLDLVPW